MFLPPVLSREPVIQHPEVSSFAGLVAFFRRRAEGAR